MKSRSIHGYNNSAVDLYTDFFDSIFEYLSFSL